MKFYGPNFIKRRVNYLIEKKRESTEALIDTVYPSNRNARVKIQGSSEFVYVDFPANWKEVPHWLRAGQAVRLRHTRGARGRLEIESHAIHRPSLQSGDTEPTIPTGEDVVISGLSVKEIPGAEVMKIYVTTGTVRFSGSISSNIYIQMDSSTEMIMGYELPMGDVADVLALDAAPAVGLARYDLIVLGDDYVFDVVKGAASTTPTLPNTPANHVLCGFVLVVGGTTSIKQSYINKSYSTPILTYITIVADDNELSWAETSTDLTATAYDQYGSEITQSGGWLFTLEFVTGNGTIENEDGETSGVSIEGRTSESSGTYTFTYTRDQLITDESPTLKLTIADYLFQNAETILLYDEYGDLM